jgi:hypothetical protein
MNPESNRMADDERADTFRTEDERASLDAREADRVTEPARTSSKASSREEDYGTPYLADQAGAQTNERWQHIQSTFVDDPRQSVTEAHQLVSEVVQHIVDDFARERNELEEQWSKGDSISTEDLRVCLQRYRAFFSRLLPSMNTPTH